jgi:hypothetical protein
VSGDFECLDDLPLLAQGKEPGLRVHLQWCQCPFSSISLDFKLEVQVLRTVSFSTMTRHNLLNFWLDSLKMDSLKVVFIKGKVYSLSNVLRPYMVKKRLLYYY